MTDPVNQGGNGQSGMTAERLREILDAYGASPNRWPPEERTAAVLLLDNSEDARAAHAEAMRLDIVLDHANAPPPSPELADRLHLQGAKQRTLWARIATRLPGWLTGSGTQPGALRPVSFALTMVLGVLIGVAVPDGGDPGAAPDRTAQIAPLAGEPADTGGTEPAGTAPDRGIPVLALIDIVDGPEADTPNTETIETNGTSNSSGPLDDIPLI